jgi:hypothetical protein
MNKLSKQKLALLSLLVPVGFAFDGFVNFQMPYVIIGYAMIFIGGMAFGSLLRKGRE